MNITDEIIEKWAKHGWTVDMAMTAKFEYEMWSRDELSLFDIDAAIFMWDCQPESAFFAGWKAARTLVPKPKLGMHSAKLTEDQVLEIRASKLGRKELTAKYGISPRTYNSIIHRTTWKHLK